MAIEDYLFPMQSLTTKAAMEPGANMMGLATSPFAVGGGQAAGGGGALMGLAGLVDQYGAMKDQQPEQMANTFQSQTPGAPTQPGRIDQSSFGGQQGQQMDPLSLLDQNINRRFGM